MELACTTFGEGQTIPRRYTCDGEDLSPPLTWTAPPEGTVTYALLMEDPDAPRVEPFVHWIVADIPAEERGLIEGIPGIWRPPSIPARQGVNSFSGERPGYRGPAPPRGHGPHRYYFHLFALDARLDPARGFDKRELLEAMEGHVLARASLMGTYER